MKRAMVIAHQDDEVLWGIPEPDTTVFCCSTPHNDPKRVEQFFQSCWHLGVLGLVSPQRAGPFINSPSRLNPHSFLSSLDAFDEVLTHNAVGEYSHPDHIKVHDWVMNNYRGPVRRFGYGLEAAHTKTLTDEAFNRKIKALQCYNGPVPGCNGEITWRRLVSTFFGGKLENLRYERFSY